MAGRLLAPHADKFLGLLRLVAGLMFSMHGMQKVFGWLAEHPKPELGTQMWLGGILELACGLLIVFGLFTRLASFVASGEMAVAYLQFHWKLFDYSDKGFQWLGPTFDNSFWPVVNKGELAVLYCFVFLYFASRGNGALSVQGGK